MQTRWEAGNPFWDRWGVRQNEASADNSRTGRILAMWQKALAKNEVPAWDIICTPLPPLPLQWSGEGSYLSINALVVAQGQCTKAAKIAASAFSSSPWIGVCIVNLMQQEYM